MIFLGTVPAGPHGGSVTINLGWLIAAGFCGGFGLTVWKLFPWAIKRALRETIEATVSPDVKAINARIDAHMDNEENSLSEVNTSIGAIEARLDERTAMVDGMHVQLVGLRDQLDTRTALFDEIQETLNRNREVLEQHVNDDRVQFEQSSRALVEGQGRLLARLEGIELAISEFQKVAPKSSSSERTGR
jgi:hypothetical protein